MPILSANVRRLHLGTSGSTMERFGQELSRRTGQFWLGCRGSGFRLYRPCKTGEDDGINR